ncbi:MAG: hypothetical protein Q7T00_11700 [Rugosibacter sp.]|jgi:hypothetical protein|nr:hypothetical protein [Rugosibacter sp.]
MKTHVHEVPYLRLLIGGIAAVLLVLFGIAAMMAWVPASTEESVDKPLTLPTKTVVSRVRVNCAECGVVVSTREIDQPGRSGEVPRVSQNEISGKPSQSYEVTIRMKDGSSRVFLDAHPVNWRPGERIIFIQGASQLNN